MSGLSKLIKKRIANSLLLITIFSSLFFCSFTSMKVSGGPFDSKIGTRILFDESHNPYYGISGLNPAHIRDDGYRLFDSYLEENDYEINILNVSSVIDENLLHNYDIFIICASQTSYSNDEIDAIYDWTINGGSLLLLAEYGGYSNGIKSLARKFGYSFFDDRLREIITSYGTYFAIPFNRNNMIDDVLFNNVESLVLTSVTGFILRPDNSEEVLFTDVDGNTQWASNWNPACNVPIISKTLVGENKYGKMVICCDATLWDIHDNELNIGTPSFDELDNAQFALNIINWLVTSSAKAGIPFIGVSLSLFFSMSILVFISQIRFIKQKK